MGYGIGPPHQATEGFQMTKLISTVAKYHHVRESNVSAKMLVAFLIRSL